MRRGINVWTAEDGFDGERWGLRVETREVEGREVVAGRGDGAVVVLCDFDVVEVGRRSM